MYEDANTAASIVAAVLETAGYVVQAQVLQTFGEFWQKFGFLLYLVASAAGLMSVVLSGGYRGARMLLIAPTLFYFMVMERSTLPPAVWQFGQRDAAPITDRFTGPLESYKPPTDIQVSRVFAIYTRLSSQFMGELSRRIMKFHDDDSFLFIARNQAMYSLMSLAPQTAETSNMLTYSLYQNCPEMFNQLVALSGRPFSADHINLLTTLKNAGDTRAAESLEYTNLTRASIQEKYRIASEETMMTPDTAMRDFMVREVSMSLSGAGKNYAAQFNLGDANTFVQTHGAQANLTCGQALQVFEDAAIKDGTWFQKYTEELQLDQKLLAEPKNRSKLCNAIASKFHATYVEGESCNLGMVAMVMVLRNRLMKQGVSSLVDSARSQMNIIPSQNNIYCLNQIYGPQGMQTLQRRPGEAIEFKIEKFQDVGQERTRLLARGADSNGEWCTASVMELPGMLQTVIDQQHNDARGLLQKIYAFALNLPYYQGVMLFWLGFAYPFMAMFLLLPGRAGTFLYAPLAWIWLKSWDVGFAIVAVFDKVLWNVLPKSELPYSVIAPANDILPDLLGAVLRADPTYDVHAHFNYIALAMLAIPTLTGAIIMRGKTQVFSAFVSAAGNDSKESYDRGRAVSAQYITHERSFRAEQMEGMLLQGITNYGSGMASNPNLPNAASWGVIGGTVSSMSNFLQQTSPLGAGSAPHVRNLMMGVKAGSSAAMDVFEADVQAQGRYVTTFDRRFGIDGTDKRLIYASLSGLDGNLTWTSQGLGRSEDVWEKDLDALMKKIHFSLNWSSSILKAGQVRGAQFAPTVVGGAGVAVDGILSGGAWGYSWGPTPGALPSNNP